ncbi:MAG: hypothetical protein QXO69_00945 [archaeon]
MDDSTFFEFTLAFIIAFLGLNYIIPGAYFVSFLFSCVALVAVFFFLKGCAEFVFGKGTSRLLMGAAMCVVIIVLFGGTNAVLGAFRFIMSIFGL